MDLRWTEEAADDLEHIANYLFENVPGRAAEIAPSRMISNPSRTRNGMKGHGIDLAASQKDTAHHSAIAAEDSLD